MYVINAHFARLDQTPITNFFGGFGVYVLWSPSAKVRPSYLGEGNVISRFAQSHIDYFGPDSRGHAALLSGQSAKSDGETLEMALLAVAEDINRWPVHNRRGGNKKHIGHLWKKGINRIRLNLSGYHPLKRDSKLSRRTPLHMVLEESSRGIHVEVQHPFRRG